MEREEKRCSHHASQCNSIDTQIGEITNAKMKVAELPRENGERQATPSPERGRMQCVLRLSTNRNQFTGLITIAGTAFALVVGRVAYDVMHAFIHLDFYTVAEIGFVAGFTTAGSGAGLMTWLGRVRSIDVDKVLSKSLEMVKESPKVAEIMGLTGFTFATMQTGTIRTYQHFGGTFGRSETSGFPAWQNPRVQLMYQVWGGSHEKQAIVVTEAYTKWTGQTVFNFVSFDLLEGKAGNQGNNPTVLVVGDASQLKIRNEMRSYVTLNRVYVKGLE